ncbi:hypothetical protein BCR34DRAFT_480695 [Clohesyomyces aquaticus]|uniref:Uncharacterized protein n=1 Tax=Clohesyomyces aquaticus TaxID=1231657 RepID=A0A1Y1ZTM8_9PLEO|nr:hypothetical protein BCR34DRAFT_480695 [Clohesyomyces aquaticus]
MFTFLKRIFSRGPKKEIPPFDFARNRFPAKKQWPPNLHELSAKQQWAIERKYKRRVLLKSIRPAWDKSLALFQWTLISGIVVYSIFFYDFPHDPTRPGAGKEPFEGPRTWMRSIGKQLWTHTEEGVTDSKARRLATPGEEGQGGGPSAAAPSADTALAPYPPSRPPGNSQ